MEMQRPAADYAAREQSISDYFAMWLTGDGSRLEEIFSDNVVYEESVGTEYHGIRQIVRWFSDWNKVGKVLCWDIKSFYHTECKTFVEWYFECVYDENRSGFDGVSIAEFDDRGRITFIREFAAQHQRACPYGD